MAQASQSAPAVSANIRGSNHQVNLRDYLNMRVAPFLKKAITESLDAAPEFPLQWLGENLIHQSMLYEGNPDSTQIQERFLYKFDAPVPASTSPEMAVEDSTQQPKQQPASNIERSESPLNPTVPVVDQISVETSLGQDAEMSNHVNGDLETSQDHQVEESRDTEMTETS